MNRHTFKDVGKRSALSNELDHDDDEDDHEASAKELKRAVEGEEEEGDDKVCRCLAYSVCNTHVCNATYVPCYL